MNSFEIFDIRVDLLRENLAADITGRQPCFSWKIKSGIDGAIQTSYRLTVSAHRHGANESNEIIWDSGEVFSSDCTGIEYSGSPLEAERLYFLTVALTVNGESGKPSPPVLFRTAAACNEMFAPAIWSANDSDMVFLRREFRVQDKPLLAAVMSVFAASYTTARQYVCELRVNGDNVGFAPRNPRETAHFYSTINIAPKLHPGVNCTAALGFTRSEKLISIKIQLYYSDGETTEILSDSLWRALPADDIFRIGTNIGTKYYFAPAENVDLRLYPSGFSRPGFDDSAWSAAHVIDISVPTLYPAPSESMKRITVSPAEIRKTGIGRYFIDMGKEIVGGIKIKTARANKRLSGKTITLRYAEERDSSGRIKYEMRTGNVYEEDVTLSGDIIRYTGWGFKAFRYITVSGCPSDFSPAEALRFFSLRMSDSYPESDFACSGHVYTRAYDYSKYTVLTASQELYVDSQTRERGNYEGDTYVTALSQYAVSGEYSLARFSIEDLAYNPTWPLEYKLILIMAAKNDFMYTGDKSLIKKIYPILQSKTSLSNSNISNGFDKSLSLIYSSPKASGTDAVLVDWPPSERDGYRIEQARYNTVVNAFHFRAFSDLACIAAALGYTADAQEYTDYAEKIRSSMIEKLLCENGLFCDGLNRNGTKIRHFSQHASVFPLALGVLDNRPDISGVIARRIHKDGVMMSVYGMQFLLDALYKADRADIAAEIMESDGLRSYEHLMDDLSSTMCAEAWDPENKNNMTFSHSWGSAPANTPGRGIFGIEPLEAGFGKVRLTVRSDSHKRARIHFPTVRGVINASFENTKTGIKYILRLPANMAGEINLRRPDGHYETVNITGGAEKTTEFLIQDTL